MSLETVEDEFIFDPVECDECEGHGCERCHWDGELCGTCRDPVSACDCGACEGELQ